MRNVGKRYCASPTKGMERNRIEGDSEPLTISEKSKEESMDLYDTTADEERNKALTLAKEQLKHLKKLVGLIEEAIVKVEDGTGHGAVDAGWVNSMMESAVSVSYNIGKANGACLVRAKTK